MNLCCLNNKSKDKIILLYKACLLIVAFSVYLPFWLNKLVICTVGILFCLLPTFRKKLVEHKKLSVMLLVFTLTAATVALCNGNYIGLVRTGVFAAMIIIAIITRATITGDFFEKLLDFICIGGCFSTVISIIERLLNLNIDSYRCKGLYTNANFFGTSLMLVILICVYKIIRKSKNVYLYYLIAAFNAVGIYLCGSMMLWVIIFVGGILLLFMNHKYKLLLTFLSVTTLIIISSFFIPQIFPRLFEIPETLNNRISIWKFAIEQIKEAPLFGRGFFTYKFLYNEMSHFRPDIYKAALAHSVYLDCVLCHGIIGTELIISIIFTYLKSVFNTRRALIKQKRNVIISSFIIVLFFTILLYGIIDTTFIWSQTGMVILFVLAGIGVEEQELNTK